MGEKAPTNVVERGEVRNLLDIGTLITVTEARISPDLKYCVVYFVCTDPVRNEDVKKAMQTASAYFKRKVAGQTDLKFIPQLVFKVDDTFEKVDDIEKLLRNPIVAQDIAKTED